MARTDNLTNFLTDVSTAIKTKKGDNTPIPASNFDTEITNLPTGGGSKFAPHGRISFDYTGTDEKALDLKNLDTTNITSMSSMFQSCTKIKTLDLSSFNTSNVTSFYYMFYRCDLQTLDLSSFNTSKVTNMSHMFDGCGSLATVNLSSFDTSNVTDMGAMFSQCTNLITLDLSNFNMNKVSSVDMMFYYCRNLQNLKIKIVPSGVELKSCPLTAESITYILQNLASDGSGKTLTLGATNLAKATQEDLDSATSKGWTIK